VIDILVTLTRLDINRQYQIPLLCFDHQYTPFKIQSNSEFNNLGDNSIMGDFYVPGPSGNLSSGSANYLLAHSWGVWEFGDWKFSRVPAAGPEVLAAATEASPGSFRSFIQSYS
jgi:hypothetical protein